MSTVDASRPTSIPGVAVFHRREAWQNPAQPVTGPRPTLEQVDTFPLHYTAASRIPANVAGYLRAIQNDYLTDPNRGYSIGYGFAVDQRGEVWELRGYDIKNAANLGWNHRTLPVLCLVDGAAPLTEAAVLSVRALLSEANRRTGRTLNVVAHRDIGATACPGDGITAQIRAGRITPLDTDRPQPPTEGDDEMTYLYQPPVGREGSPWFVVARDGGVRIATGKDAADLAGTEYRDPSPAAVKRYDLMHESVLGRTP